MLGGDVFMVGSLYIYIYVYTTWRLTKLMALYSFSNHILAVGNGQWLGFISFAYAYKCAKCSAAA